MDFLKKKPEIKKRTLNYNFNESKLDEYTDIQIDAFVKDYYKHAKKVNKSTAYNVPDTPTFHSIFTSNQCTVSIDRSWNEGHMNVTYRGIGVWNSKYKRTLAKIIE